MLRMIRRHLQWRASGALQALCTLAYWDRGTTPRALHLARVDDDSGGRELSCHLGAAGALHGQLQAGRERAWIAQQPAGPQRRQASEGGSPPMLGEQHDGHGGKVS